MADDKADVGRPDRDRVAADEPYELSDFARKHGISHEQARNLIARHGNSRARLDAAVERLRDGERSD